MRIRKCNQFSHSKYIAKIASPNIPEVVIELSQKKFKQGWLRTYFFEKTPGISRFVTLPLEIPDLDKTKLYH